MTIVVAIDGQPLAWIDGLASGGGVDDELVNISSGGSFVSDDDANGWTVGPAYALAAAAIAGTLAASSLAAQIANTRYESCELPIPASAPVVEDDAPRAIIFDEQRFTASVRCWRMDEEVPALHVVAEDDAAPRIVLLDDLRLAQAVRSWQADDETPTLCFTLDTDTPEPPFVWAPDPIPQRWAQDDDVPTPSQFAVELDVRPPLIVWPQDLIARAAWLDDETPALQFTLDADILDPPVVWAPDVVSRGAWQDDDAPTLMFTLDADTLDVPVVWPPDAIPRIAWQDDDIVSISIDEDSWKALEPEWPSLIVAAQWSWDDADALPIQSGSSVPDEWSWIPPIPAPPPTPPVAWRFDADESISTVSGALEEYTWTPVALSVPTLSAAPIFDDGGTPSPATVTVVDEDIGPPLARFAADLAFAASWADDDGGTPIFGVVDEDYTLPLVRFTADVTAPTPWADDEGAKPSQPISDADEYDWPLMQSRRSVVVVPFERRIAWDGLETATLAPYVRPATEPTVATATSVASVATVSSVKSIAHPVDPDGVVMDVSTLEFTQGETGPVTIYVGGEDGIPEDLSTVQSAKWNLRAKNGRIIVKRVDVTGKTSGGHFVWTRLDADVARAGEYVGQLEIVRIDSTRGELPTGGLPVIIHPAVIVAGA